MNYQELVEATLVKSANDSAEYKLVVSKKPYRVILNKREDGWKWACTSHYSFPHEIKGWSEQQISYLNRRDSV